MTPELTAARMSPKSEITSVHLWDTHTHTDTHTSLYASVAHINHVLVRQQAGSQAGSKSVRQLARQAAVPTNKAAKTQVGKCSS